MTNKENKKCTCVWVTTLTLLKQVISLSQEQTISQFVFKKIPRFCREGVVRGHGHSWN